MVMTKQRSKSHKGSKSYKGSKSHKRHTGGKKQMGSKSYKGGKKHMGHKGGLFLSTAAATAKEALLPFLMYKAQKQAQKRVTMNKGKTNKGKTNKGEKLRSKSRKTAKSRR